MPVRIFINRAKLMFKEVKWFILFGFKIWENDYV